MRFSDPACRHQGWRRAAPQAAWVLDATLLTADRRIADSGLVTTG
jgi:hypothetical protein